jgi:hypothetical protein
MPVTPEIIVFSTFTEVPPPAVATIDDIADTLGLVDGLRADKSSSPFRCD